MEHNDGGLEDHFPFFSWSICRFHVNLPGCTVVFSEIRRKKTWDAMHGTLTIMGISTTYHLNWLARLQPSTV